MVSLVAQVMPGGVPSVRLGLEWDIQEPVRIMRRDPDATRPVRGAEPASLTDAGTWLGVDLECPFGVPVVYEMWPDTGRAALVSNTVTLNPTAFYPNDLGWSTERGAVWLRHLTRPNLSMPIDLANAESPVFKQTRAVVDVLDRRSPIVITDGRRKELTTTLDIRTWSLEEAARLRALLADNSVVLLTVPAGERWGITHWYCTVGDVTEERLWQEWAPYEGRVFHLPVEIVDRPVGGVVYPECCYGTERDDFVSYLDLAGNHATYALMSTCTVPAPPPVGGGGGGGTVTPDGPVGYGLALYTSASDANTAGAVRGPGTYQYGTEWAPTYWFTSPPGGTYFKFLASYTVQSSEDDVTLDLLFGQGRTFPTPDNAGWLTRYTAEGARGYNVIRAAYSANPLFIPEGDWSVSYAVSSPGQWVEGPTADPTQLKYRDGVWVFGKDYPYTVDVPNPDEA